MNDNDKEKDFKNRETVIKTAQIELQNERERLDKLKLKLETQQATLKAAKQLTKNR